MFLSTLLSFASDTLFSFMNSKLGIGDFISQFNPESELPKLGQRRNTGEIWSFISHFKNGFARASRFRIEFKLPKGAMGVNVFDVNQHSRAGSIQSAENKFNRNGSINIKAHTVTFPQRALQTFEIKHNSMPFKIPYTSVYDPVTFTFYSDSDMDVRRYFDIWQGAVMNFSNNTINFYNEYVSDIRMYVENDRGEDVYGIVLIEAYPMGITPLDMSYSSANTLLNVATTFSYKYWLPMDSSQRANRSA